MGAMPTNRHSEYVLPMHWRLATRNRQRKTPPGEIAGIACAPSLRGKFCPNARKKLCSLRDCAMIECIDLCPFDKFPHPTKRGGPIPHSAAGNTYMYINLFDSHTHSENSPDGHHSVTFMVESAVAKNVQGLAITDHCDCDFILERNFMRRMQLTALDVAMAREAFRNRVIITFGIELGEPNHDIAGTRRIMASQRYDFVLLSLHRLRGRDDFIDVDFAAMSPDEIHQVLLDYFAEMMELLKVWDDFDSLAHLTIPLRYLKVKFGIDIDTTRYLAQIDAVLRFLVEHDKALEINTSGLRSELLDTLPPAWVLRRFKELGGNMVTLGSDAHYAADIGEGIAYGMQMLLDAGFTHFTFFRGRKPVMLRII